MHKAAALTVRGVNSNGMRVAYHSGEGISVVEHIFDPFEPTTSLNEGPCQYALRGLPGVLTVKYSECVFILENDRAGTASSPENQSSLMSATGRASRLFIEPGNNEVGKLRFQGT